MSFKDRVIEIIYKIPEGKVVNYGQVAEMAGSPRAARMVGSILFGSGIEYPDLPWWRVINSEGRISIKNPHVSPHEQKELLEKEGIVVSKDFKIDINKYRWVENQA